MAGEDVSSYGRRGEPLSRERIVVAATELLNAGGEEGLTFRALSERLATGPGAIYGHVANKSDLLLAAGDAAVARALERTGTAATPEETIRAVALTLFDLIDDYPWVGTALTSAAVLSPVVRVLERIGQQLRALAVGEAEQWAAAGTLVSYILGVSKQNAANRQLARVQGLEREAFLGAVSAAWSQLEAQEYAFTRSVAGRMRDHDDREDFLRGIDLILAGVDALRGEVPPGRSEGPC